MAKNLDALRYASEITRAQDSMRFTNEELIKLSQRFGRMIPGLQKLDNTAGVLSWFAQYNKLKDCANKADEALRPLLCNEDVLANPVIASLIAYYGAQRSRYCFKIEVMDDILNGMIEDLTDGAAFNDAQKEEINAVLGDTLGRSMKNIVQFPVPAA
jgi:hypothetical protein